MDLFDKKFTGFNDELSASSIDDSMGSDISLQKKFKNFKCVVITQVKKQIVMIDMRFHEYHKDIQWCNSFTGRIYRHKYNILILIVTLISLYAMLIYGAIFGASVCSKGMRGSCCNVGYLPGIHYTPNKYSPY